MCIPNMQYHAAILYTHFEAYLTAYIGKYSKCLMKSYAKPCIEDGLNF